MPKIERRNWSYPSQLSKSLPDPFWTSPTQVSRKQQNSLSDKWIHRRYGWRNPPTKFLSHSKGPPMGGYGSRIPRENQSISRIPQNFLALSCIPQDAYFLLFLYLIFLRLLIFSLRNNISKMHYSQSTVQLCCALNKAALIKDAHQYLIFLLCFTDPNIIFQNHSANHFLCKQGRLGLGKPRFHFC